MNQQNKKEEKYILIAEKNEGIGAIHQEALCHIAYATALDALGVSEYLTNEQIRKFTSKKTTLSYEGDEIALEVKVPIKRDLNTFDLIKTAQKEIQQNFADFLSIKIDKINLVVDQVFF